MSTAPLIIDTDPGVDDFLALLYAFQKNMNVIGITTIFGNAALDQTTVNALTIREILGRDCPIYAGASRPLRHEPVTASAHGSNALGAFALPTLQKKTEQGTAEEFLIQALERYPSLTIACLGPLTNLASVARARPDLFTPSCRCVVLGGVFGERGNISPFAEFNTYNDPLALEILLATRAAVVLIPANVCRKAVFSRDDFDAIPATSALKHNRSIVDAYIGYYEQDETYGGFAGGVMYDVLTIAYLLDPALFRLTPCCVSVDTSNEPTRGRTSIGNGPANCLLATDVDGALLKERFFAALQRMPAER